MNMREQFEKFCLDRADRFHPDFSRRGLHPDAEYQVPSMQNDWEVWQGARLSPTTCPGHGRSECVSCCWPKSSAEDFQKLHLTVAVTAATESRVKELANLLTLAKAYVPVTDPLRGLINANLMQHRIEQGPKS